MAAEPLKLEQAVLEPTLSVTTRYVFDRTEPTLWEALRGSPLCVLHAARASMAAASTESTFASVLRAIAELPPLLGLHAADRASQRTVETVLAEAFGAQVLPMPTSWIEYEQLLLARLTDWQADIPLAFVDAARLIDQVHHLAGTTDYAQLLALYAPSSARYASSQGSPAPARERAGDAVAQTLERLAADSAPTAAEVIARPVALPLAGARTDEAAVLARQRRDALLASEVWLTGIEVLRQARGALAGERANPYEFASRLRRERRLFGVQHGGHYLHPAFQFDAEGQPLPGLDRLLALLPASTTNWSAAFWLFQPTGRLDGARPADVFATDPERVIAAAEKDFRGDHESW